MTAAAPRPLPDGLEDVLPDAAAALEALRRGVLDCCARWGYRLVLPPLAECPEAGGLGGEALERQSFGFTDPLDGRRLAVRADLTPQAARIDRQHLPQDRPARLCYAGTVLRVRPEVLGGGRSPLQAGAELYGHDGPQSDLEIVLLLCALLRGAGVGDWCLGLGHAGVFRALAAAAPWSAAERAELFGRLQRKARADIDDWLEAHPAPPAIARAVRGLPDLCGPDEEVLARAAECCACLGGALAPMLDALRAVAGRVRARHPEARLHFDLGEAWGFRYERGLVFAAYVEGQGQELARGGRYEAGPGRPATGFSLDLRTLARCASPPESPPRRVWAPAADAPGLEDAIGALRAEGCAVVRALDAADTPARLGCDERLVREDGAWTTRPAAA